MSESVCGGHAEGRSVGEQCERRRRGSESVQVYVHA